VEYYKAFKISKILNPSFGQLTVSLSLKLPVGFCYFIMKCFMVWKLKKQHSKMTTGAKFKKKGTFLCGKITFRQHLSYKAK
jgi:hypothetical protein